MKSSRVQSLHALLLCSAAGASLLAAGPAAAQAAINIEPQPLVSALNAFGVLTGQPVISTPELTATKTSPGVQGADDPAIALTQLLAGTGLSYRCSGDTYLIVPGPQAGPAPMRCVVQGGAGAADDGAEGTVEALIVTAQKREEAIQDVPIAISAFTQESLEEQKIEGGFDLLKAIPNVTFSKNNFTSYNFSIRGIGTKAVSASTDPGVAVSFNNIALLQNRLFEQEYFDVERVEVLRGPQGTLYGRNATAGVINVISAKPDLNDFSGWIKGEVGNHHTKRASAMLNIPLIEDKVAVRFAGAFTDRQGFDYNSVTKNHINGRDLWSARVTLGFEPTESISGNLIWERFEEDDSRSRTGKQLCHRDDGPEFIDGVEVAPPDPNGDFILPPEARRAVFGQGCKAGSLYDAAAFGTPNGLSYNFVLGLLGLKGFITQLGYLPGRGFTPDTIIQARDPYGGMMQSRDLREVASFRDPRYRAKADVIELNIDFDITPTLTLSSQTAYNKDQTYSFQDYNRFNTQPVFIDTSQLMNFPGDPSPSPWADLAPGGIFCDPQLGCSDTVAGFDIAKAKGDQFTQELRLQSDFEGPINFSLGATYTRFRTLVDYYVMFNLITAMSRTPPFNFPIDGVADPSTCFNSKFFWGFAFPYAPVPRSDPHSICPYIDPNPVESMDGEGHNYFRSKNPYRLKSFGGFGEIYWEATQTVKVTAGLRYSDDRKTFIPVPSQVLLAPGAVSGGYVSKGYPEDPPIKQHWGEWTGRLGVDWRPELGLTEQTMLYAFYSRGYKAGGANPPSPGFATVEDLLERGLVEEDVLESPDFPLVVPVLSLTGVEYSRTFDPEFVNAFEVGAKNTLLGGALTFNASAFLYDYENYQVSQIRDRTAVNENFDAHTWGLEFETMFSPSRNFQLVANLGYLDTKIADGETSIDIMSRNQGDPNYTVVKPWAQLPSNCVVPTHVVKWWLENRPYLQGYWHLCGGLKGIIGQFSPPPEDTVLGGIYDPLNYPEINGGAGLLDNVGGNELPNAPHWTANIGAQYGWDVLEGWRVTIRGDGYWQSQSWARVYNSDPYDKLHGWYNANLSLWIENEDGLKVEIYAKNILNDTPITDSFLNSDDTGLTTNVFVLDPRLIGLSIRKEF